MCLDTKWPLSSGTIWRPGSGVESPTVYSISSFHFPHRKVPLVICDARELKYFFLSRLNIIRGILVSISPNSWVCLAGVVLRVAQVFLVTTLETPNCTLCLICSWRILTRQKWSKNYAPCEGLSLLFQHQLLDHLLPDHLVYVYDENRIKSCRNSVISWHLYQVSFRLNTPDALVSNFVRHCIFARQHFV